MEKGTSELPAPLPQFDPRYVVECELGRGAMGRVFLARDLRLDRLVAIKALAPGTHDAQELLRLEHEARAAGSLNHPNIIAVHDIGASVAGPFIVSEYLRGKTLRQLLNEGPLPLRRSIELAAQLAQGLAAAHERHIIHRDLKPENLLVTDDGWLKILDFGIAKRVTPGLVPLPTPPALVTIPRPVTPAVAETSGPALPIQNALLTSPGAILGTVGYMSPEQVRGHPADARSDLFAFGLILYEMLSGARAFSGATPFVTSTAILKSEPAPLPESVPAEMRAVVARCLRKDPRERFQSARSLSAQLEQLRPTGEMHRVQPRRTSKRLLVAVGLSLCVALVATAFAWQRANRAPPSFRQLTFHPGAVWSARFGPGGKVYYAAAWDWKPPHLFETQIGNAESQRLSMPDAKLLAVSPAGELAILLHPHFKMEDFDDGTLATVAPVNGTPLEKIDHVDDGDYAPDGTLAVVRTIAGESRLEFPPGRVIARSPGWISSARVSPQGDLVAYLDHPADDGGGSVMVVGRDALPRVLTGDLDEVTSLAWSPSGEEVWFSGNARGPGSGEGKPALRAVSLSGKERLITAVGDELHLQDIAADGRVLVTEPHRRLDISFVREGSSPEQLSWFDESFLTDVARDGSAVLLTVAGGVGTSRIYYRPSTNAPARLLGPGLGAALAPDSSFAVVIPSIDAAELLLVPLHGGPQRSLPLGGLRVSRVLVFPDAKRLLLVGHEVGRPQRLFVRPIDSQQARPISPEGSAVANNVISPDGTQVASVDAKGQIVLYPVDGGRPALLANARPDEKPLGWDAQGVYLGVLRGLGAGNSSDVPIDRLDPQTGKRERWRTVSPGSAGALGITRVMVAENGKSIAYNYANFTAHLYLIDGLK